MSLEEIRLNYENESGFTSAKILRPYLTLSDKDWAIIAERYAQQRVNEVLDKAAEEAKLKTVRSATVNQWGEIEIWQEVDLESILKLKNQ